MNHFLKSIVSLLFLSSIPLLSCSADEGKSAFVAGKGKDYEILAEPVKTTHPDKIEVAEAFWYGCSHCYHFEPFLEPWVAKLPADVYFIALPVSWGDSTRILHSKMFFTAQQLGKLDTMHAETFKAMSIAPQGFTTEAGIANHFAQYGVAADVFTKTFRSFGVDSLVKQADAKTRSYNVTGTPTLVINGKYKIMGDPKKVLAVADFLIEKERAALAKTQK